MRALILAGGLGTRLKPYTDTTPKPLLPIAGTPVIEYVISYLKKSGISEIIVNIHYLSEQFRSYFDNSDIKLIYEKKLSGTGGIIKKCLSWLGSEFVVCNGDTIANPSLHDMIELKDKEKSIITIFSKDDFTHNGGVFVMDYRIEKYLKNKCSLHEDVIPKIKDKSIYWGSDLETYFDIGTPEKYLKVNKYYEYINNRNQWLSWGRS